MPPDEPEYQAGFGNAFATEAQPGALPPDQNTPRQTPYRLVTEQLNGTGFTVRRDENLRTWLYRLRPQIVNAPFRPRASPRFGGDLGSGVATPEVMRFRPLPWPTAATDFVSGLTTFAGVGDPLLRKGMAIHIYAATADMERTAFCNADGDLLIAPQHGRLHLRTELGDLGVGPAEIAVVPRGIRWSVQLPQGAGRGFVAELFDGHFRLPERGPIGANGMAAARHFLAPRARFDDDVTPWTIVTKQGGQLFEMRAPHSPFDVVAWHGNYVPFKYDLRKFNSMGSVSFDHVDPSILTVLTSPLDTRGRNAIDVGVFLGRWDVSEHTFRPPYFHRNVATEFNAVIASPTPEGPWSPGVFSYTPSLTPHGIAADSYAAVVTAEDAQADRPTRGSDASIWLQFESAYALRVMPWMLQHPQRDETYLAGFEHYRPGPELP